MRLLRAAITLAIFTSLGYSHCTGGLYSVPVALALGLNLQQEIVTDEKPLMLNEQYVCFEDLMSHALEESSVKQDHAEQDHKSECDDGSHCISQAQQILTTNQSSSLYDTEDAGGFSIDKEGSPLIVKEDAINFRAQTGPLYAFAKTAAHIVVKKE